MSEYTVTLAFAPEQYVIVTLFGLNYKGRVNSVCVKKCSFIYEVEYADDKGDLVVRSFRDDELALLTTPGAA